MARLGMDKTYPSGQPDGQRETDTLMDLVQLFLAAGFKGQYPIPDEQANVGVFTVDHTAQDFMGTEFEHNVPVWFFHLDAYYISACLGPFAVMPPASPLSVTSEASAYRVIAACDGCEGWWWLLVLSADGTHSFTAGCVSRQVLGGLNPDDVCSYMMLVNNTIWGYLLPEDDAQLPTYTPGNGMTGISGEMFSAMAPGVCWWRLGEVEPLSMQAYKKPVVAPVYPFAPHGLPTAKRPTIYGELAPLFAISPHYQLLDSVCDGVKAVRYTYSGSELFFGVLAPAAFDFEPQGLGDA